MGAFKQILVMSVKLSKDGDGLRRSMYAGSMCSGRLPLQTHLCVRSTRTRGLAGGHETTTKRLIPNVPRALGHWKFVWSITLGPSVSQGASKLVWNGLLIFFPC